MDKTNLSAYMAMTVSQLTGMSPVHISPYGAVWIILKIKVIFTVFINQIGRAHV